MAAGQSRRPILRPAVSWERATAPTPGFLAFKEVARHCWAVSGATAKDSCRQIVRAPGWPRAG
eukprot:11159968-Lingulodinium_polyedra.AAC.1